MDSDALAQAIVRAHRRGSSLGCWLVHSCCVDCDRSFRRGLIGPMEGSMVRMIVVAACSLAVFSATAQDRWVTDDQYAEMQKNFAEFAIAKTPMG